MVERAVPAHHIKGQAPLVSKAAYPQNKGEQDG
jgi:hypothetical protein